MEQGFQDTELTRGQIIQMSVVRQPVFEGIGSTRELDERIQGEFDPRITAVMGWHQISPYQIV